MYISSTMVVIIIAIVTLLAGWFLYKWRQWRPLPPGPWGLPVLGYLPFIDKERPHLTLTALADKYGSIYSVGMGSVLTIVLSDHKLVREAFGKEEFSGRAPLYLTHGIMEGNGIICAEGPLWKDQRRLVTIWLKHYCRSAGRVELDRKIDDTMRTLLAKVTAAENSGGIDLPSMVTELLGNTINDLVFGCSFPSGDQTWQWLRRVQEEGCHEMGVAGVVNFLPFIRFFSSSTRKTIDFIKRGQRQTHRVYAKIIAMRREYLGLPAPAGSEYAAHANLHTEHPDGLVKCIKYSNRSDCTDEHYFDPKVLKLSPNECILDSFLHEQKRRFEARDVSAAFTSDEQLLYLLADLFGAGLDTTSVTLSWFLLFVALHQGEQDVIRKEILERWPEEGCVVEPARLPRLMAALCEVQRMRSVVPVGIPHGCVQDCELAGYMIPKGAMVMVLQWAIHTNPGTWTNPHQFNPARFLDKNGSLLKPREFMPFQIGKRMCPGDELSRLLAAGVAARLLRRCRVRVAAHPKNMHGHVGVTLEPDRLLYICEPLE